MTPANRGGSREGAGRKSAFPGKGETAAAMDFTPAGRKALQALVVRSGLSRNDVIAHLVKRYARKLKLVTDGVVYPGKAQSSLAIRLPSEVMAVLEATRTRTGKSFSDIGEALVRRYGRTEKRFPILPGPDTRRRSLRARKRSR